MSIHGLMVRACNEDAVYWGSPTKDGYGGLTYADPIEIKCRWDNTTELVSGGAGEEYLSRAQVFVLQDIEEQGYLFHGTLDDLESGEQDNPNTIVEAFRIQRFTKIPNMNATGFVRKAFL